MQMRAMGPGAGWRWLMQAVNLGRNNPKAIFGAAALLIMVALVPTAIQLIAQLGFKLTSPSAMLGLVGFSILYSLLVMPPILGGFLRVIHATESGQTVQATTIFDVFKNGQDALRMIVLAILLTAIAFAVIAVILAVFGSGVASWYLQVITASQGAGAGATPAIPALPESFGMVVILVMLFGLFVQGAYAIAFGQISLTDRSIGGALSDGMIGALKNLLPLLVLLVIWLVFAFALILVVTLLASLLMLIGGLVHPALGAVLAAPVYLAFILVLYVVIVGVMYHLWRDVAGGDTPVVRGDQHNIAV